MIKFSVVICMIILIISSYFFIKNILEYKESNDLNMKLIENVITEKNIDVKDEKNGTAIEIDWEELEKINEDIVGWIKIDGTKINYPILKDDDSLKYIDHSVDGKYNSNGAIFTLNAKPFQDNTTIIFGHNMKNGNMFATLGKYMNKEFFNEHQTFYIYTKSQNYKATVFSCYSIQVNQEENNIEHLNFDEEIEYYKKHSKFKNVDIGEIKKIVKLSTCSYINNHTTPTDQRYFIVASINEV